MERAGIGNEYQDIRDAAVREEQLSVIEVTDRVMARVRGLNRSGVRAGSDSPVKRLRSQGCWSCCC